MEGLRELLEGGAAVDERGMWESTPLLCAAQYRHEEAVRLLLEHGADPGAANERGCTPLLHACVEGLETAAELLLERGAPVNVERAVVYNHARGALAAAAERKGGETEDAFQHAHSCTPPAASLPAQTATSY